MVEYVRLLNKDTFTHLLQNWDRQDTISLLAVLGVVLLVAFVVAKK